MENIFPARPDEGPPGAPGLRPIERPHPCDECHMGDPKQPDLVPSTTAQAQSSLCVTAKRANFFQQQRAQFDESQESRQTNLVSGATDPRLWHDPFAPRPRAAAEDLQHEFPRDMDWTSTRFGTYKLKAQILPPTGTPDRPSSPGPYTHLLNTARGPAPHPDARAPAAIRPAPRPSDIPALSSIPAAEALAGGHREDLRGRACQDSAHQPGTGTTRRCRAPAGPGATAHCQDGSHAAGRARRVCAGCDDRSKSVVLSADGAQLRRSEVAGSRAYACAGCLAGGAASRERLGAGGVGVWGYAEERGRARGPAAGGGGGFRGGFRGAPTPVWGCGCTKLLAARLCAAHRLGHAEAWLAQVGMMQEWLVARFGGTVCPLCYASAGGPRQGVDAFGFAGEMGGEGCGKVMWGCLSCQEYVVVEREKGRGVLPGIETLVVDRHSYWKGGRGGRGDAGAGW